MKKTFLTLALIIFIQGLTLSAPGNFTGNNGQSFVKTTDINAEWKKYKNSMIGFSIKYLSSYTKNTSYTYTFLTSGSIPGVSFNVPAALTSGTNLTDDSYISVEWLPAGSSAKNFLESGESITEIPGTTAGGETYTIAERDEAATGNYYYETVYAVSSGAHCFGIRLFIHSTNLGVYDPGAVKAYDRRALMQDYYDMIGTFVTY